MTYVQDRNMLRALTHKLPPHEGKAAFRTFVYVLISHMRNKIHMKEYKKYYGGWRFCDNPHKAGDPAPADYVRTYGEVYGALYYAGAKIETMEDQAAWIQQKMREIRDLANEPDLIDIAQRVLDKNWEEPARKVDHEPEHVQTM